MKIRRNAPCWCGSGLKFKACHLDREQMSPPPLQDLLKGQRQVWSKKVCLHPEATLGGCVGPIVSAHTVQRSGVLSRIARSGHVYSVRNDLARLIQNGGKMLPELVGINEASTFTGFCGRHDDQTFAPLEKHPFTGSPEQCFLLAYRALCMGLYEKRARLEDLSVLASLDRGRTLVAQVFLQNEVADTRKGVQAGLRTIESLKQTYDDALRQGNHSAYRYCVLLLDRVPELMCSGLTLPEYDFAGKLLQDLRLTDRIDDHAAVSIFACDGGGAIVFGWLGDSAAGGALVRSLRELPKDRISDSVVRFAFETFDNIYFAPDWWDSLPERTRSNLVQRTNCRYHGPNCLVDDGLQFVHWRLISMETNLPWS